MFVLSFIFVKGIIFLSLRKSAQMFYRLF